MRDPPWQIVEGDFLCLTILTKYRILLTMADSLSTYKKMLGIMPLTNWIDRAIHNPGCHLMFGVFLFLMCLSACATTKWDKIDYTLLGISTGLQVIDWRQTRCIAENPDKYWEINPVLGKHPSKGEIDLYFAGSFAMRVGVARILSGKWRKMWLSGWIGASAYCVITNDKVGIGIRW